jgi:UDP-N-acetylmuramyl pentapeptide phosphotransferase/UDP-N-acetylglucosamine-1-phosphate transferase
VVLFFASFLLSAVLTLLLVRGVRHRGRMAMDHDLAGPQKVHARPVARVGGLAIFAALLALAAVELRLQPAAAHTLLLLLACGVPVFAAGVLEDLTKRVGPGARLLAAVASAALAVGVVGTTIARTDLWGFDWIVASAAGGALLSIFVVTGIANAVNIIDGFNGLASMSVLLILLALAYVANQVGDPLVLTLAVACAGAVLGFFVWNYPAGLIFLGDGGAYFLGFFVAELALLLVLRNDAVSPLFPLLATVYPVFETLFSMYRRRILRGRPVAMPDGVHLHSLVYRRLLRWAIGREDAAALVKRNALTAPYLWALSMLAIVPSVIFWDDSRLLGAFIVLFGFTYTALYIKIVRFRAPRWLVVNKRRVEPAVEPPRRVEVPAEK